MKHERDIRGKLHELEDQHSERVTTVSQAYIDALMWVLDEEYCPDDLEY